MATKKEDPKELNLTDYAKETGVEQAAISYRVKHNLTLPGVSEIKKFGRFYVLTIIPGYDLKKAKAQFVGVSKITKFENNKVVKKTMPVKRHHAKIKKITKVK